MYAVLILMVPRFLKCCEFTMLAMPRAMECIVIEILPDSYLLLVHLLFLLQTFLFCCYF